MVGVVGIMGSQFPSSRFVVYRELCCGVYKRCRWESSNAPAKAPAKIVDLQL